MIHASNRGPRRPALRPRAPAWAAFALASAVLGACAAVQVDVEHGPSQPLASPARFVWAQTPPTGSASVPEVAQQVTLDDPGLMEEVRLLAEDEFRARGLTEDAALPMSYVAVPRVWVEVRTERRDPWFSGPVRARYEVGGVSIDLFDVNTGEHLWRGAATSRLRDVALGYGVDVVRYAPANEERKWRIADKVRALFRRFPLSAG